MNAPAASVCGCEIHGPQCNNTDGCYCDEIPLMCTTHAMARAERDKRSEAGTCQRCGKWRWCVYMTCECRRRGGK